jgi:hypothetical protein
VGGGDDEDKLQAMESGLSSRGSGVGAKITDAVEPEEEDLKEGSDARYQIRFKQSFGFRAS